MNDDITDLKIAHYCAGFFDLLGQKDVMPKQKWIPLNSGEKEEFLKNVFNSVGSIYKLQRDAKKFIEGLAAPNDSSRWHSLSDNDKVLWNEIKNFKLSEQRWSDGLLHFVNLGDENIQCHMNGVFALFSLAGMFCFLGLARSKPVRGAIDVGWGVELQPAELFGGVVATAYALESEIAKYPRMVVSDTTISYLQAHIADKENTPFTRYNKLLARSCLDMIAKDHDGVYIVDYLGAEFQAGITNRAHDELYDMAYKFIEVQLKLHTESCNAKLLERYGHLLNYFNNRPKVKQKFVLKLNQSNEKIGLMPIRAVRSLWW